MNTNPTDQAFPGISGHFTDRDLHGQIIDGGVTYSDGLTKREYLAALAMQGILAANMTDRINNTFEEKAAAIANTSVRMADALLARLAKG